MFIVYDLIFLVISIFYLPIYLFKRKLHSGFFIRLGILPKDLNFNSSIWIHAVSVGEVQSIRALLRELKKAYPHKKIVISTVTSTGNKVAKTIAEKEDFVTYLPFDLGFCVKRVIDKINPGLFILTETEFWPNLISYLFRKKIPIILVNGRISKRSFKGYRMIKPLLKSLLEKINLFCMQTEEDAQRIFLLGVNKDKIKVTGNMKFDATDYTDKKNADYMDYKTKLSLEPQDKLFVAGSTHPKEEEIILSVYQELLPKFKNLKLLLAPRHPERAKEVGKIASAFNFQPVFITQLSQPVINLLPPVFILDTIGQLINFYALSDIVFVGGSLVKIGGHNILEPLAFSKPVLFGPYMFNFKQIVQLFLENQAVILVHNAKELKENIADLLNNPLKINQLTQKATALIQKNQGATQKNLEYIKNLYPA